jgi:hypothetical protein
MMNMLQAEVQHYTLSLLLYSLHLYLSALMNNFTSSELSAATNPQPGPATFPAPSLPALSKNQIWTNEETSLTIVVKVLVAISRKQP